MAIIGGLINLNGIMGGTFLKYCHIMAMILPVPLINHYQMAPSKDLITKMQKIIQFGSCMIPDMFILLVLSTCKRISPVID